MKLELLVFSEYVRKTKNWDEETKRFFLKKLREKGFVILENGKQYIESKNLPEFIRDFENEISDK